MISLFSGVREEQQCERLPFDTGREKTADGRAAISLLEFLSLDAAGEPEDCSPPETQEGSPAAFEVDPRVEQVAAMLAAAREEARAAERVALLAEHAAALTKQNERVARLTADFARDRQRYFSLAEESVVQLALAVARKVLAREVRDDRLHLAEGVKRVLAKLGEGSKTRMRVHVDEIEEWSEILGQEAESSVVIDGDAELLEGECLLETEMGQVEFSVAAELADIDRSFAELLPNPRWAQRQQDAA